MQDGADTASDYNRLELSLVNAARVGPGTPSPSIQQESRGAPCNTSAENRSHQRILFHEMGAVAPAPSIASNHRSSYIF